MLNTFLIYFGAFIMILVFLYGTRNYLLTVFGGFVSFCVFYFSFSTDSFEWTIASVLTHLKTAAIFYFIPLIPAIIIYKVIPAKPIAAGAK